MFNTLSVKVASFTSDLILPFDMIHNRGNNHDNNHDNSIIKIDN